MALATTSTKNEEKGVNFDKAFDVGSRYREMVWNLKLNNPWSNLELNRRLQPIAIIIDYRVRVCGTL